MVAAGLITLFLSGDVMTGRGIDQILPHPAAPVLFEPYVRDARDYVRLAEARNGPIPRAVDPAYVWGDALRELASRAPDARIVNLETAVTRRGEPWADKGIHYRMRPANLPCLTAAGIDVAALANNHVLDWGYPGLRDTLDALREGRIRTAGAGLEAAEARAPAVLEVPGRGRVVVFAVGSPTSGIPRAWAASGDRAGVTLLPEDADAAVRLMAEQVRAVEHPGDVVVLSVHWGSNWGYEIPGWQRELAHRLIDDAGVDVVHGHSSHHPRGIEVYRGKLVLYGCGDLLTDYEGIGGYEEFRGDLGLMYFAEVDPATGLLAGLRMRATRMRRFQVRRADAGETAWLAAMLNREGAGLGTRVRSEEDGELVLEWERP